MVHLFTMPFKITVVMDARCNKANNILAYKEENGNSFMVGEGVTVTFIEFVRRKSVPSSSSCFFPLARGLIGRWNYELDLVGC